MVKIRRDLIGTHTCTVERGDDSDSGLPKCDPSAGKFRRRLREFRKIFLASFHNSHTHIYIKSRHSLLAERRRHIRSRNWFVIHPLSIFAAYREIFMTVVWIGYVITEPFITAFAPNILPIWGIVQLILLYDVCINFILGYIEDNTMEIILDIKLIAKRYLLSYFLIDLATCLTIPMCMAITGTFGGIQLDASKKCAVWAFLQTVLRFFRMFTAFSYLSRVADFFSIGRQSLAIMLITVTTFVFVHYSACLTVAIALYIHVHEGARDTFLHLADVDTDERIHTRYAVGLIQACSLFFRCNRGIFPVIHTEERVLQTCVMVGGLFYFAYVIVMVYDIINVSKAVGNKFEEILEQLQVYMLHLNLPKPIRKRILAYYEYRFEKKYFRETAILDTLSEHLRYEIMLFTCMPLVQKANFFRNLPKPLIGQIIAVLKREVYLCNDVIFKTGEEPKCMFFIYCGTVAAISEEGFEFLHYEDGDNFGEGHILTGGIRRYSAVAAEITEAYSLSYIALRKYLKPYPQFMSQIRNTTQRRHSEAAAIMEKIMKSSNKEVIVVNDTLNLL